MFVLFSRPPRPDAAEPEPPSERAKTPIGRNPGGMQSSAT